MTTKTALKGAWGAKLRCQRTPQRWCKAMAVALGKTGESNAPSAARGLDVPLALNLNAKVGSKHAIRAQGVRYRTSAKDPGLMFNHCPWCGADLRWWEAA